MKLVCLAIPIIGEVDPCRAGYAPSVHDDSAETKRVVSIYLSGAYEMALILTKKGSFQSWRTETPK